MMEVIRYKYIFITLLLITAVVKAEKVNKVTHKETCPITKILEDIFRVNKSSGQLNNSERAKLFLHSIANITSKKEDVNQEKLVDDIIAAINRIKNNMTKESNTEMKLNEAIILNTDNNKEKNKIINQIKSGIEEKSDVTKKNNATNEKIAFKNDTITSTEKTNYVEILTIEPNNTQKTNVSSNNIIEVLKHLMPMLNTTTKLHNITIIEKNINRNHSYSTTRNVSTIIVTYCDHDNQTKSNNTLKNNTVTTDSNDEYDYYADIDESDDEEEEDVVSEGDKREILEAAEYGMRKMHELYSVVEPKLYSMGFWLDGDNPARYVAAFNAPSEDAANYTRYGYASLQAAAKLKELISGTDGLESRTEDVQFPTASVLRQSALMQHCPLRGAPKCPPASKRYRTHDGTCNNFNRPRWGSTMTPVQRYLPPSYSDGLQAPRRSIFGTNLPSAREISALIHESKDVESPGITHLLMQWGQFVDHDVTSSSQSRGFNGSVPRCCKEGGKDFVSKEFMHPECLPIAVPASDPFYGPKGVRCLDFVRSSPAPRDDCALGWREQLNQVSAYIDGSPLYASSARHSDKLRLFRNGMLQYGRVQQRRPILPPERRDDLCRGGAVSTDCFKSGDARVNEHPGLVAAHIVWLRQHNRMAQELTHLNPHWSDEKIYQETRKIVGAMIQHITYREFLPVVLGSDVMEIFELDPQKKGYYKGYSPKINASPASSFGSAAFRFGHSLVQPSMMRYDRFHRPIHNNVSLHMELTNPSNIWSMGAVDRLLLGMANQPIQRRDEFITHELTNHLFQGASNHFGMDLAAINIQRGRDHGVPPYTSWREPCGLSAISGFEDLFKVMPARVVRKLKVLYRHVDDVDLFTGGMAERPVVGGLVGPTFACIIAQQFSNLRKGDRFWYENGGFDSSFTPAQLQQIRRISFAQVLCRTLDTIDDIQPFAFLSPEHPDNDRISCQNGLMNDFDLSPWVEIDSEFDNDIRKSDRTEKPHKLTTNKPTTKNKPSITTKMNKISSSNSKRPQHDNAKTMNMTKNITDDDLTSKDVKDSLNFSFNIGKDNVNATVHIDDKLDFKNKSKRFDDTDSRNKPSKQYDYDYDEDDEDTQAVQSVVVSQGHRKRPYHYQNYNKKPILTVTENVNKFTYLINYVPRPTESYRRTTRKSYDYDKDRDRDIIKVTYQTYDDTYRRPNKPYYYRPDFNDNYRNNRPNTRTTEGDYAHSSARSNDYVEQTTKRSMTTKETHKDKTNNQVDLTTENMYKLLTFSYVGSYKGDMDDKLAVKSDKVEAKHDIVSKDFTTHDVQPKTNDFDKINKFKLSTFYLYDSSTKPYNLRSTRRNDDNEVIQKTNSTRNVLRYPDPLTDKNNIPTTPDTTTTDYDKIHNDILKENYNSPGIPKTDPEERMSLDNMPDLEKTETKAATKLRVKVKKPTKPAETPSVAFQVIPSEISPSQWAVYDEDSTLSDQLPHRSPAIKTDPHALKEIPKPIATISLRRRRPGL